MVAAISPAADTAARLSSQLSGSARVIDLLTGPRTIFIDGTITTKAVVGCGTIIGKGSFGVGGYQQGHPNSGAVIRIVQVGKGPLLRLSGSGFVCETPIEWVGDGESAAIEVEGRIDPPSGRHRFRNQIFTNCGAWIKCLATPDEAHADMSIVDGCEGYGCKRVLWSQSQQALGWKFRDCAVNVLDPGECVVADLERGGWLTFDNLILNHPRVTIFRLRDYSPNNCKLVCRNFLRDLPTTTDQHLTLIDYTGDPQAASWSKWNIDISGFAPECKEQYRVSDALPRDKWKVSVN